MRVIGGAYRGRRLRTLQGLEVRPTSDRLRETLFNILSPYVRESRVLDLCAGSGAVGVEALSRAARLVTFVDRSRRACGVIEENLRALDVKESATIINRDAVAALKRLESEGQQYDIIFFDPPYRSGLYLLVMEILGAGSLLSEGGLVVVEHHSKQPLESRYGKLSLYREVKQGESALAFYNEG